MMSRILKKTWVVCLLASVSCFFWGSAFPGIKIGYEWFRIGSLDAAAQILFAGCRFFLAGLMVILFGSLMSRELLRPKTLLEWKHATIISMFQTVLQYILFYMGLANTAGTKASIIVGSNVFIAIIFTCLVFKQEALTKEKLAGCLIGFVGVVLINLTSELTFDLSFMGEGLILISTTAYAISSSFMKDYSKTDNPVMLSGYQFFIGGIIMMAAGFLMGGRIGMPETKGILMLLYLSFASAAAYTIWSQLLKHNPVSKVAVFCFMTPVFGVILSALLLEESGALSLEQGVTALILITIGIFISHRKPKQNMSIFGETKGKND